MSIENLSENISPYNVTSANTSQPNNFETAPQPMNNEVKLSVDSTIAKFFMSSSISAMGAEPIAAWNTISAKLSEMDAKPLIGLLSNLIPQTDNITEVDVETNPLNNNNEDNSDESLCLKKSIITIAHIGNPNLLNECEKIRIQDFITGWHAHLLQEWTHYIPFKYKNDIIKMHCTSIEDLAKFWENYASCIPAEEFTSQIDHIYNKYHSLEHNIDLGWREICLQNDINPDSSLHFKSHKELFLSHLLKKCWLDSDGDLSKAKQADLYLLIDNKEIIHSTDLYLMHNLSADLFKKFIETFTNIEDIHISGEDFSPDSMRHLISLKQLTSLKLYNLGQQVHHKLHAVLEKIPHLKKLSLKDFHLNGDMLRSISQLSLTSLSLVGGSIEKEAFSKLLKRDHGAYINTLRLLEIRDNISIAGNYISPEDAIELAQQNPGLRKLTLCSSFICDKHLKQLASSLHKLIYLDLSKCSNIGPGALELIKGNPLLRGLVLHQDATLKHYIQKLAQNTEKLLMMDIRYLRHAPILFAKQNKHLFASTFYSNDIDDARLSKFASHTPNLESLTINVTSNVTHKGLNSLFTKCPKLKIMGIIANQFFNMHELFAFLKEKPFLEALSLELFRTEITYEEVTKILEGLQGINWINLYPCRQNTLEKIRQNHSLSVTSYDHNTWTNITVLNSINPLLN